jgi:putative ABC transport system permease protein
VFLLNDFAQAWRSLRTSPAFFAGATGVFALGLAATVFMYGVVYTMAVKPPPFSEGERLHVLLAHQPANADGTNEIPYPDFLEIRTRQRAFDSVSAYTWRAMVMSGVDYSERFDGALISDDLLGILRVKPALGRRFTPADATVNAEPVMMISHHLWRTRFDADPRVIGRVVAVNGRPTTIVAVAPEGFYFPLKEPIWMPLHAEGPITERGPDAATVLTVARLRSGWTPAHANADLSRISVELAKQFPRTNRRTTFSAIPFAAGLIGPGSVRLLYVYFGAVWLLLVIACTNVASLTFVRANFRVYEASMRVALGATRGRLITQLLAESVIVGVLGLIAGIGLAAFGLYALDRAFAALFESSNASWWRFSIYPQVAVLSAIAALLSALLAGIVPALRASRPDVMTILRDGGRSGSGLRLSRFTTTMVIVQLALAAVLITAASVVARSALLALQSDVGADVKGFMSARVLLPRARFGDEERARFYGQLVDTLSTKPSVGAVAAATVMPGTFTSDGTYQLEGAPVPDPALAPRIPIVRIMPGYFRAFGRALRSGRDFDTRDHTGALPVAIINQALLRKEFAGMDPLGKRIRAGGPDAPWLTIVGVAPDIQHGTQWAAGGQHLPAIYTSVRQYAPQSLAIAVKGDSDALAYATLIRTTVRALNPDVAMSDFQTIEHEQITNRGAQRVFAAALGAFAIIAVVLNAAGIYCVLAFATSTRNREIGMRRALGAPDGVIVRTVLRGVVAQLAIGLALGLLLSAFVPRLLSDQLQGMRADEPWIYLSVLLLLGVTAAAASWMPARRALQVSPLSALRDE